MTRLLIIIPATDLEAVRTAAAAVFGDVAHSEFVPMGSPTGVEPATHWWLAGVFSEEQKAQIPGLHVMFPSARVESYDLTMEAAKPFKILEEMGLKPVTQKFGP